MPTFPLGRPRKYIPSFDLEKTQLDFIMAALRKEGKFYIRGFGTFYYKTMKKRITYHNFSKKEIVIQSRRKLCLKEDKDFKSFIQTI